MQPLAQGIYTTAQVDAALHAASRALAFRFEVYDHTGALRTGVTPNMIAAAVQYSASAQIRRTATFTFADTTAIDWLNDRIKPFVRVQMPDGGWVEWAQGLFLLSSPGRKEQPGGLMVRDVQAYDLTQLLIDSKIGTRTAYSGNYITAVAAVLSDAGVTSTSLTATTLTMPATLDWEAGTTRLQIVNDLLAKINYKPIYFDHNGVATAVPFVAPSSRAVNYTYADDALSVIAHGAQQALDLFGVPNQVIGVVSQPDRTVLTSSYTNSASGSPTSTVNRGRTIVQFENNLDAPDQTTLDAIVFQHAWQAAQVYETVQFDTGIMPFHGTDDILAFQSSILGTSGNYLETAWDFSFAAGATMHHTAQKTVAI